MQSKKQPRFFWVSAMAPLTSVILGSVLVYFTHAEKHGVEVVSVIFISSISCKYQALQPKFCCAKLRKSCSFSKTTDKEGTKVSLVSQSVCYEFENY